MKNVSKKEVFKRTATIILVVISAFYMKDIIGKRIKDYLRPDHITVKSISTQHLSLVDENGSIRGSMSCHENNDVSVVLQSANGDSKISMYVSDDNHISFRLLQDVTDDSSSNSTTSINLTIAPDHTMMIHALSGSSVPFQAPVYTNIDLLRN